jgi:cysteine peptidase C11 family protein
MNMVEVAYQLRNYIGYFVASEEVEPGDGWPYDKVLGGLAARPAAGAAQTAKAIVARYLGSYTASDGVTDAAVDVARVGDVAKAVDTLAGVCIAALASDADYAVFAKAVKAAQRFDMKDYVDLGDLCRQLAARSARPDVRQATQGVLDALRGTQPYILAEGHKGASLGGATGTTVYFPSVGDVQVAYAKLDFAKATRWGQLIAAYHQG